MKEKFKNLSKYFIPKNFVTFCCALFMMFKNSSKRKKAVVACVAAVLCVAVGVTVAFVATTSKSLENNFVMAEPDDSIVEKFTDNKVKEEITVKNNGDYEEFIRVALIFNWKDSSGNICAKNVETTDYEGVDTYNSTDWYKDETTGYYYFRKSVKPGNSTTNLLGSKGITLTDAGKANCPEGYSFSVDVISQSIQYEPAAALSTAWGLTSQNGELVFSGGEQE